MSDTAGAPLGQPGPGAGRTLGPGAGSSPSGRGRIRRRRRRWAHGTGLTLAVVLVAAAGAGWVAYVKLDGNITPDEAAAAELERFEEDRPTSLVKGAQNILLIGSDTRAGEENGRYGPDPGTERSDTVILLHLSAGRRDATAVSIPRDLMVDVPDCRRPDGSRSAPMFAAFNSAFEVGGSACTIRTVEKLTDIRVDHHVVVDFEGFKDMVDAVDGVEVCLREPIDDKDAELKLPAGRVTLSGEQALGYVRARKTLGDGSDTSRMERQQRFLGALVTKVRGNEVLLNPVKLYPVLDAATSSLTTDPELASLRGLYELVRGLREIPPEDVQFLTVPRESYIEDVNRDQLAQPAAAVLFERLRTDAPVTVGTERDGKATERDSGKAADSSSPAPTFSGNTAAEDSCM
ncbi:MULTISPECIES: LCP family protein [unclassified Streptomyces]|uniref:LCP family protein n=1 Tax=unclassified Streptomyces TaxID=2593676 RepID=UPI000F6C2D67|nr:MULTISPECIES: LCP family protein [unclassified Streptomyces]AZM61872.1 LytR family transcriptional regulator [Streptomyces sp. WAC 01438]RSM87802.1 LytR family transcriptional regulator [Streptomyces sp. WAC 01420]